jgi:hypothetical protein
MKTKLSHVLGVGLALVLVFSLAFALVPTNTNEAEAQQFTPNQWNAMPLPGTPTLVLSATVAGVPANYTPFDFAVGNDGATIYLATAPGAAASYLAKTPAAGRFWAYLADPPLATFTGPVRLVAVAPDDPETVAIVDSSVAGNRVFLSDTGGSTWVDLGDPVLSATGAADVSQIISDLKLSNPRPTAILDRDVVVCTYNTDNCQANPYTAGAAWGDIYTVGTSTTWVSVAQAAGALYDWTSIALEPSWVGGYGIIGIGSDNVAAGNAEPAGANRIGDTYMVPFNADLAALAPAPFIITPPGAVNMDTTVLDSPCERTASPMAATETGCIVTSDVTLPDDFASTALVEFQVFLGWKSVSTTGENSVAGTISSGDNAYRVDFNSPKNLQVRTNVAINSVDYAGTTSSGKLIVGESDKLTAFVPVGVWYTTDPMSGAPTWQFSFKTPTSTATFNANCKVVVSPVDDTVVFGACSNNGVAGDTAFSLSVDGGLSFNGISFINEALTNLRDVMPTPDAAYVFLATSDNATNDASLWRVPVEPSATTWERVHFQTAAQFPGGTSIVRISPYNDAVYWFATGGTRIQKSTDNGQIFGTKTSGANPRDAVVESADVVYEINGTNVYVSTTGGTNFGLPINANLGVLTDIAMCPSYPEEPVAGNVLVGSAVGAVGLSLAGAAAGSFIPLVQGVATGNWMQVLADKDYATNNTVYCGSNTAGEGIYRYVFGTSTIWEQIRSMPINYVAAGVPAAAGVVTGLATHCGTLYASWDENGAAPSYAARQLYPLWSVADMNLQWDQMSVGSGARLFNTQPNALRAVGNDNDVYLYAIDTTPAPPSLMGYHDAVAKVAVSATVTPTTIPYDPNTNSFAQFTISWPQISNSTEYDIYFTSDSAGTNFVTNWGSAAAAAAVPVNAYIPAVSAAPSATITPTGWAAGATTLTPGHEYYVFMRVREQATADLIRGPWAAPVKITLEAGVPIQGTGSGPTLLGPEPGATDVSLTPGFSWSSMPSATEYEFTLATDAGLNNTVEGTPVYVTEPAWQVPAGTLEYDTIYFWGVRVSQPVEGPISIGTFTTLAEAAAKAAATPLYIWIVIAIGAILVIAVIWLIFSTRRA